MARKGQQDGAARKAWRSLWIVVPYPLEIAGIFKTFGYWRGESDLAAGMGGALAILIWWGLLRILALRPTWPASRQYRGFGRWQFPAACLAAALVGLIPLGLWGAIALMPISFAILVVVEHWGQRNPPP